MSKTSTRLRLVGKGGAQHLRAKLRRVAAMASWVGVHEENTRLIPLSRGMFAKVDAADYEWLNKWNWYLSTNGYPVSGCFGGGLKTYMHQFIAKAPKGMETDHRNRDKLDNRRHNLRICTEFQNRNNKSKRNGSRHSKYKGVYPSGKFFCARICKNKKKLYIGLFESESEAAIAYDKQALKMFGEFAYLNFK